MPNSFNNKIIIIGTGPGALSCANDLLKNGYNPLIIERGSKAGGFMQSICYKDYQVDLGRKELYSRIEEVNQLWKNLLGKDYIQYDYRVGILYDGIIIEKSSAYKGFSRGMNIPLFLYCVLDFLWSVYKFRKPNNYEEFMHSKRGAKFTEIFSKGFYEKFTGRLWRNIPIDQNLISEYPSVSLINSLKRYFFDKNDEKNSQEKWRHPSKGSGQIISRLIGNINLLGGEIYYNTEIIDINTEGDEVKSITIKKDNKNQTIDTKTLISSIPLESIHKLIFKTDTIQESNILSSNRGTILVYLFFNSMLKFKNIWLNVSCPKLKIGRITNYGNFDGKMVPSGKACLCIELFLNSDDILFEMKDERIIKDVISDCNSANLFNSKLIEHSFVIKLRYANAAVSWEDYINDPQKVILYKKIKKIHNLYNINRAGTDFATYAGLMASSTIVSNMEKDYFELKTDPRIIDPWNN